MNLKEAFRMQNKIDRLSWPRQPFAASSDTAGPGIAKSVQVRMNYQW